MGFFSRNFDTRGIDPKGGKVYKLISSFSILGIFAAVAIIVFAFNGALRMSPALFGFVGTILIVCSALSMSLYWIKRIEKKEFKRTAIVFLSMIAVCALLWIICLWVAVSLYNSAKNGDDNTVKRLVGTINFIKATLIVTLQFFVASFVAQSITRLGKSMLIFQIVSYISYLFFDFYITFTLTCVKLSSSKGLTVSSNIDMLWSKTMITLLVLSIIYVGISTGIMKSMERKMVAREYAEDVAKEDKDSNKGQTKTDNSASKTEDPTEKLKKLKELLDKNLITQEEYDAKRAEILKDM